MHATNILAGKKNLSQILKNILHKWLRNSLVLHEAKLSHSNFMRLGQSYPIAHLFMRFYEIKTFLDLKTMRYLQSKKRITFVLRNEEELFDVCSIRSEAKQG